MLKYGFSEVTRNIEDALSSKKPTAQKVQDLPTSKFASSVLEYAKNGLPAKVLYHSLRVYQYSLAILNDQFPEWKLDHEVLFTTCLLHDIGTTDENMKNTKMSFEFYGGIIARDLVIKEVGDKDFADAVGEAIIRHQDLGDNGTITRLGLILQISTILDNVGLNTHIIHSDTLDAVNKAYPRDGWLGCFADAIDNEKKQKPWGHTSSLGFEEFKKKVLENKVNYEKL